MGESVFEVVKQSVTAREAAELYGIAVGRGGMACCPFHDDRHPSMKVDTRFHCFGCGADGDVIDFTARLYDLSPKGAAEKLAQDFGLSYDSKAPIRRSYVRQKTEAQVRKEKREHGWRVLTDYYHLLRKWEADYSPKTADEDPHPRFLEAVQKKDYMGYLLDTFLDSSTEEQDQWIAEHTAEISAIEGRVNIMADKPTNRERLQQITAGIEQGIKELFESEKYMRYLSVMSRFHRYSVNNTMLIYMQKPDATLVAGYNKWKNQFERHVKKGEHIVTRTAKPRMARKLVDGKYVKYMLYPKLGEKARNNGHVVYSLDFEVTPHQLRHTYITNLIHSSVDPKTVQYLAGHESSKITMDIYAKVKYNRPDDLVKAMGCAFDLWDAV